MERGGREGQRGEIERGEGRGNRGVRREWRGREG